MRSGAFFRFVRLTKLSAMTEPDSRPTSPSPTTRYERGVTERARSDDLSEKGNVNTGISINSFKGRWSREDHIGAFWMNKPAVHFVYVLVSSWQFKSFMTVMILINAVELGFQVEFDGKDMEGVWKGCDHFFTSLFAMEMIMKMTVLRLSYFHDAWNILDFFVVWVAIVDTWIFPLVLGDRSSVSNLTVIRVFRLCKISRMLKVLTIERQLQILVEGIAASLRSMFWIGLLLALILYAFGVFCVTLLSNAEVDGAPEYFDEEEFFGSVPRAMITLFNVVLLTEWDIVVRGIYERSPGLVIAFVIFVIFTSCGILNVIIGVIVEQTNQAGQRLDMEDLEAHKRQQLKAVQLLGDVMFRSDLDKDGYLSIHETHAIMSDESFLEMLKAIRLPKGFGVNELYKLLDQNADKRLSQTEFVEGTYQLIFSNEFQRACLTQLSIAHVRSQLKSLQERVEKKIDTSFDCLSKDIQALSRHLQVPVEAFENHHTVESHTHIVEAKLASASRNFPENKGPIQNCSSNPEWYELRQDAAVWNVLPAPFSVAPSAEGGTTTLRPLSTDVSHIADEKCAIPVTGPPTDRLPPHSVRGMVSGNGTEDPQMATVEGAKTSWSEHLVFEGNQKLPEDSNPDHQLVKRIVIV